MPNQCKVTLKSYEGAQNWATLTVETGSSLFVTKDGILSIKASGDSEVVYTHESELRFNGLDSTSANVFTPSIPIGASVVVSADCTYYVVEGVSMKGTWQFVEDATHHIDSSVDNITAVSNAKYKVDGETTEYWKHDVNFRSGASVFVGFRLFTYSIEGPNGTTLPGTRIQGLLRKVDDSDICFDDGTVAINIYDTESGWKSGVYQTLDFGTEGQIVSKAFYDWFFSVAADTTPYVILKLLEPADGSTIATAEFVERVTLSVFPTGMVDSDNNTVYKHTSQEVFLGLRESDPFHPEGAEYVPGDVITLVNDTPGMKEYTYYIITGSKYEYYVIKAETLRAIAEAIRLKTGETNPIKVEDFAEMIKGIASSGVSEGDLATDEDIDNIFTTEVGG